MLNLVLYQPDIPQNFGAMLRLSACMGCAVHVIEPCGFPFDHAKLKRAGMDYIAHATYHRHLNWQAFLDYRQIQDAAYILSHPQSVVPACVASHGEPPRSDRGMGAVPPSRLLLLETDGTTVYTDMAYAPGDYIVLGSEGAGTPRDLYAQMDATLRIPMRPGVRSLNVAMSAGMLVAEACRQHEWRW